MIYLDYAANTPVDEEVLDSFVEATRKYIANPNSNHEVGILAREAIDDVIVIKKVLYILVVLVNQII